MVIYDYSWPLVHSVHWYLTWIQRSIIIHSRSIIIFILNLVNWVVSWPHCLMMMTARVWTLDVTHLWHHPMGIPGRRGQALDALGYHWMHSEHYEADDLIATYVWRSCAESMLVDVGWLSKVILKLLIDVETHFFGSLLICLVYWCWWLMLVDVG